MIRRLLALGAAAAVLSSCGDEEARGGTSLIWAQDPYVGTPSRLLPDDHVLVGTIRNDGSDRVQVHHQDVRLLEADGDVVPAGIRFTNSSGHGLYPPTREPDSVRPAEDLRIGRAIDLEPGGSAPLVVAWRDGARPATLDFGVARLAVPGGAAGPER